LQPVFKNYRRREGKVAEKLFETCLCLPSGSALTENQLQRVVHAIEAAPREHKHLAA